jgi:hypothetical protein
MGTSARLTRGVRTVSNLRFLTPVAKRMGELLQAAGTIHCWPAGADGDPPVP